MIRRRIAVGLLLVAVVLASASVAAGRSQVVGSPDIEVSVTDNRLSPNERASLNIVVSNAGDVTRGGPAPYTERVKTARNVRVSVDESRFNGPLDVKSGTVVLGAVQDGAPRTASFEIEMGDAEPGRYRVPVEVEYDSTRVVEYTRTATPPGYSNPEYREFDREVTQTVEIVVESEPRFEVVSEDGSSLYAGDTGMLSLTLRNTGEETARDATVRLTSGSENVGFGPLNNPSSSTAVSALEIAAGETETVSTKVNARPQTTPGEYPVTAQVEYLNENGVKDVSDSLRSNLYVGGERRFRIDDLQTESLRVGEDDATVTGTVVNTGPATAHNAVVTLSAEGALRPTGPESAVGDLPPNGSEQVEFRLAVTEDGEPGNRSLSFGVEYENSDGDVRTADTPVRKRVTVGGELDKFEVVGVNTSVASGGSGRLELDLRNSGEHEVENANAKVFVNDPLSSSDNSAFLGSLEPGETKTAVFTVSATGDAVPKEYDASLQVRYDDRTGDTELADGMSFGLPVDGSSGGVPALYVGAAAVVVAISGGVYFYRRR